MLAFDTRQRPAFRQSARRPIDRASTIRAQPAAPINALVRDLSREGVSFESAEDIPAGGEIRLGLPGVGTAFARVVRREGALHGCAFTTPLSTAQLERAFATNSILHFPASVSVHPPVPEVDMPEVAKWPMPARVAFITGTAATLWALILVPLTR